MLTVRLTSLQAKALGVECLGSHTTVELTDALQRDLGYAIEDAYSLGYHHGDKSEAALFRSLVALNNRIETKAL